MLFLDQIRSVTHSCLTLCDPMNRSTPGLPVHHQLPEFTQTHVHRVTLYAAKSLQSCPTLRIPIDGSPPGSSVPGILQARTLEWAAISFSNAWKWKVKVKSLSRVWPSATPWTTAFQASLSMVFSRQEYWSGVPLPSPLSTLVCSLSTRCSSSLPSSPFSFQHSLQAPGG